MGTLLAVLMLATGVIGGTDTPRGVVEVSKSGWEWQLRWEVRDVFKRLREAVPTCAKPLVLIYPSREDSFRWVVEGICGDYLDESLIQPRN